ncbi:MAG: MFS transporter [Vicinamibacterales bacterium]
MKPLERGLPWLAASRVDYIGPAAAEARIDRRPVVPAVRVIIPAVSAQANDPREISGWMLYDWANSAFVTTVVTVLAGPYLTALAQAAVSDNGVVLRVGPLVVTAKSLFPYCISASVFLQVLLLPLLGPVADFTDLKKPLMAWFTAVGASATVLMFFVEGQRYLLGGALLIVANLCFGASLVLYNAFLNDIATPDRRDAVSSRGYALGYIGGGVLLALNLGLLTARESLGISQGMAVRLSLASSGLWWGGFAWVALRRLARRRHLQQRPGGSIVVAGLRGVAATFQELRRLPQTLRFLLAYMSYNDGIQTVISVSSLVLAQELFVAKGLPVDDAFLIELVLMIQFVAFAGALVFERLSRLTGARLAIVLSLVVWTGLVVFAYGWLDTKAQAWAMGAILGLVLGGSQALSRSLFSLMIPGGREGAFFSLYEISERGTSWIGPLVFGMVAGATGSYRQAILSLIVLIVGGMLLLLATDTDAAIAQADADSLR